MSTELNKIMIAT